MSEYSISASGNIWHVNKDGRFFCTATSEALAKSICESLKHSTTPTVQQFRVGEVLKDNDQSKLK